MKGNMCKEDFVRYLRKRGISISEFCELLDNWFDLTTSERDDLRHETNKYKRLKGIK